MCLKAVQQPHELCGSKHLKHKQYKVSQPELSLCCQLLYFGSGWKSQLTSTLSVIGLVTFVCWTSSCFKHLLLSSEELKVEQKCSTVPSDASSAEGRAQPFPLH